MAQHRARDFLVAIASTVMKGEPPHLPPPATVTDDRNWDREGPSRKIREVVGENPPRPRNCDGLCYTIAIV